jgi:TonB family protein
MLLAALALAVQAAPAPATAPAPRPPLTLPALDFDAPDWQLAHAAGSCAATVALPNGARLVVAYHGGQNLGFVNLIDPALGLTAGGTGQALVRFGALPEESVQARVLDLDGTLMLGLAPSRNTGRLRGLAEAGSITISFGGRPPVTHAVPGAREGVERLLACAEAARAALPVAEQLPRATLTTYFTSGDYPREAVRARQQGAVRLWLRINAEGRVSDCRILQSSGTPLLDETTCNILRERARYTPAHNAQGQPVESFDGDYTINWRLP